ncbi:MAG: SpoIIE family protein phosphatase [bacterium]|nr:SpoIIE family protein phosphatase [bacterium]
MSELHITLSDGRSLVHRLGDVPAMIGRDPSCEIALDEPSASRQHARIRPAGDAYVIEDQGSKNSTLVNGAPTSSARLFDGDVIMVGAVQLVFRADPGGEMTAAVVLTDELPSREAASFSPARDPLSLPQRRLEMLYELSGRLTSLRTGADLLEDAMDICFETLRFERGAIAIRPPNRRTVDWPVVRNLRDREGGLAISRTLVGRAMDHGERAIVNEGDPNAIDPTVSMVQHGIRSAMCVPLMHDDEILGIIYGDRVSTGTVYSSEDVDFLSGLARQIAIGLINSRLMEEQKLKVLLENEISLARDIQRALFPATLPNHAQFEVAALNKPGRHVSGDYYDVIELGDGRLGVLIADVTGEGVASSLLMANLQAAVRVTLVELDDPGVMLTRWNRLVYGNTDASKFITCMTAILEPDTRMIRIASAGHHAPWLLRNEPADCGALESEPGFPLGVVADAQYTTTSIELGKAPCTLYACTDGVFEAMDPAQQEFGHERMHAVLAGCRSGDPQELIDAMHAAILEFAGDAPQSDDITMLTVRMP